MGVRLVLLLSWEGWFTPILMAGCADNMQIKKNKENLPGRSTLFHLLQLDVHGKNHGFSDIYRLNKAIFIGYG